MPDIPIARLHLPRSTLGECVFFAVERDTRGVRLRDAQRFNYYPATPFPVISWIVEGDLHMVSDLGADAVPAMGPPLRPVVLSGPQRRPSVSWSPGTVYAISVAFYPEALSKLLGIRVEPFLDMILPLEEVISGPLLDRLLSITTGGGSVFDRVETMLQPLWQSLYANRVVPTVRGWLKSMAVQAAFSKAGVGMRQMQRLIKDRTGQSYRDLRLYARTEQAMACLAALQEQAPVDLAELAAQAEFADQSHMGREIRRVTGLSPRQLDNLMRTDEAFWFYRLMKGHLQDDRICASTQSV